MSEFSTADVMAIAEVAHEANRVWCRLHGDNTQSDFKNAEGWQVKSACDGVLWRLEHPDEPVSAQHDQWMKDKLADGWIYGPQKNIEKKTHPSLVAFEKLSSYEKMKDSLFTAIVEALAPNQI